MAFIPSAYGASPTGTSTPTPTPKQLANQAAAQAALNDPKVWAFLQSIEQVEGGAYNQLYKFPGEVTTTFNDYTKHPPAVIYQGQPYSAAGAYQITLALWSDLKVELGLTDFSSHTQDLMAAQVLIDKHVVSLIDSGNLQGAVTALTNIWAALPGPNPNLTMQQFQSIYNTLYDPH
jgi:muramidase (phage lysozyme)